jgi:hypothetical protein
MKKIKYIRCASNKYAIDENGFYIVKIKISEKLRNLVWSYTHRAWCSIKESFQKHCPVHIAKKIPPYPQVKCPMCGEMASKMIAYDTGDGWSLQWECPNNCGMIEEYVEDWWPFWFGVWAKPKHLEKIGIEVV